VRRSRTSLISLLLLFLLGCKPTCEQVCDKLVACDDPGTERMGSAECQETCTRQEELLDHWNDVQKQDAFDAELSCLYDSTCDDVQDGVCYDTDVWSF
jgi:hypothetical protein